MAFGEAHHFPLFETIDGYIALLRHVKFEVVETLRQWIAANGIRVGETIDLRMSELEVNADALVVSITEGPEVLPGAGPVVTGRFETREAGNLVRATLAGGVELVGTASHPVWSPRHQDWIGLGEFEHGDLVQTRTGLIAVQAIEPLAIRPAVYNIEVAGEHVYEVTELGVLVHNNALCDEMARLKNARARGLSHDAARLAELEEMARELVRLQQNPVDQRRLQQLERMFGFDPVAPSAGWLSTNTGNTSQNSTLLRRNMGSAVQSGEDAHHIVTSTHTRGQGARDILDEHQIDINGSANGVSLRPTGPRPAHHGNGLHSHAGIDAVTDRLTAAINGVNDWATRRQRLLDTLADLRTEILAGMFP